MRIQLSFASVVFIVFLGLTSRSCSGKLLLLTCCLKLFDLMFLSLIISSCFNPIVDEKPFHIYML